MTEEKKEKKRTMEIQIMDFLNKKILVKSKVLLSHTNTFLQYEYVGTFSAIDKKTMSIVLKDATIKLKENPSEQVIKYSQVKHVFINVTTIESIIPLEY
ncbi:MAG: hypothetical protein QW734_07825 [Candidatus Bathyarchaeia archaeon]